MKIAEKTLLSAVTADTTSEAVDMQGIFAFSLVCTQATPGGTIQIQASNDDTLPGNTQPENWANVGAAITISGTTLFQNFAGDNAPGYKWMRVVRVNGGTGAFTCKYFGKGA